MNIIIKEGNNINELLPGNKKEVINNIVKFFVLHIFKLTYMLGRHISIFKIQFYTKNSSFFLYHGMLDFTVL